MIKLNKKPCLKFETGLFLLTKQCAYFALILKALALTLRVTFLPKNA